MILVRASLGSLSDQVDDAVILDALAEELGGSTLEVVEPRRVPALAAVVALLVRRRA